MIIILSVIVTMAWNAHACSHYEDPECLNIIPIEGRHFLNQWIVEIHGNENIAKMVAEETGFTFIKSDEDHKNHYFFTHPDVPRRHKMKHPEFITRLKSHTKVITASQQYVWKPTLNQIDEYFDFVGYEDPLDVIVSTFNPDERDKFYKQIRNTKNVPFYEDENVKESNESKESNIIEERNAIENDVPQLPPIRNKYNIKDMYEMKQQSKQQHQTLKS